MNNRDKMREEFEAWFDSKHKTGNESLNFAIREVMYEGWKAFYETHVINLSDCVRHNLAGGLIYEEAAKAMLEAAGVNYK